jgi:hypothetical protein
MAIVQWPATLPQAPSGDGYEGTPHAAPLTTEMDQGAARIRHRTAVSTATISLSWRMSLESFRIFQRFYRDDLDEGKKWFDVPLWFGGQAMHVVPAQFHSKYKAAPRAARAATVSAELDVRNFPVTEPDEATFATYFNAAGEALWPDSLPPFPLRGGYEIDPHADLLRSDFEGGPANKSNLFGASPGAVPVAWVMTASQFEAFKSFYWYGLARGTRWYRLALWFGAGLDEVRVRFAGPWTFGPHKGDLVLVRGQVAVRRIPVIDGDVAAIYAVMSAPALEILGPSIHHFVHIDYPAAQE